MVVTLFFFKTKYVYTVAAVRLISLCVYPAGLKDSIFFPPSK